MKDTQSSRWSVVDLPELNIAGFSFFLNLAWEFWQTPLFENMRQIDHVGGIWVCTIAAFGDVAIALCAFWAVSLFRRSRRWFLQPRNGDIALLVFVGVVITVSYEWLAVNALKRWAYSDSMPTIPGLEVGLTPILQWLVIPPIVMWLTRRQLRSREIIT